MSKVQSITPIDEKACRALWLGVIHQALVDLVTDDLGDEVSGYARRWFFLTNAGFPFVCRMAGLEPMYVRERARTIQNNPGLLGACYDR